MDQIKNNYQSDDNDYIKAYIDDCGRRWTKVPPSEQGSRENLYSDEDQTFRRPGTSRYYRSGRDHPRTVNTVRNRSLPAFHTQHHYSHDHSRSSSRARSVSRERSWERPSVRAEREAREARRRTDRERSWERSKARAERAARRRSRSRSRPSPKQNPPKAEMTTEEKDAELINSLIEGVLWEPIRKEVVTRLGKEISAEVLVFREELKSEMKKLKQWIGVVRYQHMLLAQGISREVVREIKPRLSKLRSKMDFMYKDVVEILERKKMGNVNYENGMTLDKNNQMLLKGDVFKNFELMEKRQRILEELEELEKAEEELEKESEEFSEGYITPPPKQPHPLILTPDGCITPPLTQPSKVPEAPIGPILQPNGTFNFNQKAQEEEKEENPQ